MTSYIKYSRLGKVWYVTSRLGTDLSKSFVLRSNFRKKLYFLQGVCSPDCKVDDHCSDDEYCDYPDGGQGLCKPGCRNGADCGKCGDCVAHVCQEPECCTDADCEVGENRMTECFQQRDCVTRCFGSLVDKIWSYQESQLVSKHSDAPAIKKIHIFLLFM